MIKFLEKVNMSEIDNIAKNNELNAVESNDYEIGKSLIRLEDENGEVRAHFILSSATPSSSQWRCMFVESELSTSGRTES